MNKILEVSVRYWSDCNNNCSFCFEKEYKHLFSPYFLPSKESMLVHNKLLYELVKENRPSELITMFMGGELFHRADMKELYEGFDDTIKTIKRIQNEFDLLTTTEFDTRKDVIVFTCNLLYDSPDLLYYLSDLVADFNNRYMLSYDLWGRYSSPEKIEKHYNNLVNFAKYNKSTMSKLDLNVILSGEALRIIINEENCSELEYFKKIYELEEKDSRITISFQWPEKFLSTFSSQELYEFVKYLEIYYPRIFNRAKITGVQNYPYSYILKIIQGGKCYDGTGGIIFTDFNKECLLCDIFSNCSWTRFAPKNQKCYLKEYLMSK